MYINLHFEPFQITGPSWYTVKIGEAEFPCCFIDKDSFIVGAKVETGLNLRWEDQLYNLQIGRNTSIAEDIKLLIDVDHDYHAIYQGEIAEFRGSTKYFQGRRKGEILIGNDCWIGSGATIMNGVIIHDGAVVAAHSVVTKDVPPYTIVGGNPAKVIKKRFPEDIVDALKVIRWWDWSSERLVAEKEYLHGDIETFVSRYLPGAWEALETRINGESFFRRENIEGKVYAYIVDVDASVSAYSRVIKSFVESFANMNAQLVLYFPNLLKQKALAVEEVLAELECYKDDDCYVSLVYDDDAEIEAVIRGADVYITSRSQMNLYAVAVAEMLGKEIVSGFNLPIWES